MNSLEERLEELVRSDAQLMRILRAVRELDLPEWAVGAGVIRSTVWDRLHGHTSNTPLNDIDVAYFDPTDLDREKEHASERRLTEKMPGIKWDVTNQAGVHLWYEGKWYEGKFGYPIAPLLSLEDGVGTWPETATAVAVSLGPDDRLRVIAPLGLDDLFEMAWRRNPRQVTLEIFLRRLEEKRVAELWPLATVVTD
jgi:hypothetical protein